MSICNHILKPGHRTLALMKLSRWFALIFLVAIVQASSLQVKNDNQAYIRFCVSPPPEEGKVVHLEIKERKSKTVRTVSFCQDSTCSFLQLPSGEYSVEAITSESETLEVSNEVVNADINFYVRDGLVFCSDEVIFKYKFPFVKIQSQLYGDELVISTARKLKIYNKADSDDSRPVELGIKDGKIQGTVKNEGSYVIEGFYLELPIFERKPVGNELKFIPLLAKAVTKFKPPSFEVKKGRPIDLINLKVSVPPTHRTKIISEPYALGYLIKKPNSKRHYDYKLEELIYEFGWDPAGIEVEPGKYLVEEIKQKNVYRREILIPPVSEIRTSITTGWFDYQKDKVDFSIGRSYIKKIFSWQYPQSVQDSSIIVTKKDVPISIDKQRYNFKFEVFARARDFYSSCSVDDQLFELINLKNFYDKGSGEALFSKIEKYAKETNAIWVPAYKFNGTIKRKFVTPPFIIKVEASISIKTKPHTTIRSETNQDEQWRVYHDNWYWQIDYNECKVSYDVYQVSKINLLDFFE